MQSNAKAIALARDLQDLLTQRLASGSGLNSIRQAFDSNSWPILVLSHGGNEAEGQPVVIIRISNVDAVSKDIFGNQTFAYAPHLMELGYELTSGSAPFPSRADLAVVEWEAFRIGARSQVKEIANGSAVTAANLSSASVIADLENLYWPTKSV